MREERWIKPFFRQYRKTLTAALLLGFATFICAAALMFSAGYLISLSAEMPGNIMAIYVPVVLTQFFGIGKPILQYLERLVSHDWVLRMTSELRLKLYKILEKDAVFFKNKYRTGDILGLLAEDIDHIQNLYLRTIFPTIVAWLLYLFIVIGLGFFSLWFALIMALLLGVVIFLLPLVSVLINRARLERKKTAKNELYQTLTDNILGISDWVFSQRSKEYLVEYRSNEDTLRQDEIALNRFSRNRDLFAQVIFGSIAVLLLVWSGSAFGGVHGSTANWIAAFVLGFFPLIEAFSPLSAAADDASIYRDSIIRLNKLPEESRHYKSRESASAPFTLDIKQMSFSYESSSQLILDNLSLEIPQGQKLAILGRSGSGKSTLAALIRGDLKPTDGAILLNGVPTSEFGDVISNYIGVIQQKTYLFNATLLYNLRIGNPRADEEEIWAVLDKVGLKEMVERLPDGLSTIVDEAGLRFSGGERHRIALARILLQKCPIVILDEPTVGLDPATERALLETLYRNTNGKTLIMITHHLQGISAMDRVIFIDSGHITIDGPPVELAQTNSYYQKLLAFDRGIYSKSF